MWGVNKKKDTEVMRTIGRVAVIGAGPAENLLTGDSTDLWAINTDYEYQESALITSTGLIHEK